MLKNLRKLCLDLISCKSITPINNNAIEIIESYLTNMNFQTHKLIFGDTTNLYAKIGNTAPNLCFAGHTDVVHPGDLKKWKINPFTPKIVDGILYGRGAVDMKSAICAFIIATENYLNNNKVKGTISFLITGDEEGSGKNGTPKLLKWLKQNNEKINACIVGEPTSDKKLGDTIKIGRRGSITFKLEVIGKQGHVAYPNLAINPIKQLVEILYKLQNYQLDTGNNFFQPSNLEITTIDVGNKSGNVIPESSKVQFNIRFNDTQTSKKLEKSIRLLTSSVTENYTLEVTTNAEPFITKPGILTDKIARSIYNTLNITPKNSTHGGTSDARYIKDICPVVEFGLLSSTAHKINEHSRFEDIEKLSKVYQNFLELFFNETEE